MLEFTGIFEFLHYMFVAGILLAGAFFVIKTLAKPANHQIDLDQDGKVSNSSGVYRFPNDMTDPSHPFFDD